MRRFEFAIVLVVLASFLVAIPNARAAPCFDYDQILPDVGSVILAGDPLSIVVGGNHAFVAASAAGLQVVDISNPSAPAVVATLGGLGALNDLALDGTLLYGGSTTGLHVIDVSNPSAPTLMGSAPGLLVAVDVQGTMVFGGGTGLRYYDVTDPAAPIFVNVLSLAGGAAEEVLWHDGVVYAKSGFTLYAASTNAAMPAILGQSFTFPGKGLGASGTSLFSGRYVHDIANPSALGLPTTYASQLNDSQTSAGIAFAGTTAFIPANDTKLAMLDIATATPANSQMRGLTELPGHYILAVEVSGGYAYVGTEKGTENRLWIVDVDTPLVPSPMTVLDTPGSAEDIAVRGRYAYIADGVAGLQIVDLTDPWAPVLVGSVVTGSNAVEVAVAGNVACVRQGTDLQVIDVSNPAAPVLAGVVPMISSNSDVAMTPGFAYVQQNSGPSYWLQVIDVSNPAQPVLAGSLGIWGGARIEITGTTACLMAGPVSLVDISNPASPTLLGSTFWIESPVGMAVDGTRVYVTDLHHFLFVWDISNPAAPVRLPSLLPSANLYFRYVGQGMAASRSTVYVYSFDYGLWVTDVGNSTALPKVLGGAILGLPVSRSMRIADDVLVAAVGSAGLLVVPLQCLAPTDVEPEDSVTSRRPMRLEVSPNPAHSGTMLRYEISAPVVGSLRIYDVAGRIVRELHAGDLSIGMHEARWDGQDTAGRPVANGVYITRLETPLGTSSGRVTLVR